MDKLPISLCVITHNSGDRIKEMLQRHKEVVSEIIVVVQKSTDNTLEEAREVADLVIEKSCKGTSDPDRNWTFNIAGCPWILYLDDDEYLSEEYINKLPQILESNLDVIWSPRKNLVDGVDIKKVLGEDLQCRLFRKGSVRFSDEIHTYPESASNVQVGFIEEEIVHDRTLEGLKKANRSRNVIANPDEIANQESFIANVESLIQRGLSG